MGPKSVHVSEWVQLPVLTHLLCLLLQDLVVWMKDHNVLLSRPGASAHEAFFGVCGDVQEHQAAPQTVPG